MFRSLNKNKNEQATINLMINDKPVSAPEGSTVWAAMALHGETITRVSPVTSQPRSAYCAMGTCFECIVEIDGMPNQQACLNQVKQGMVVTRQVITEQTIAENFTAEVGVVYD